MQNPAFTISHYALKRVMEFFCQPLQALVLAIVVFLFGYYKCTLTNFNANGLVIPCKY